MNKLVQTTFSILLVAVFLALPVYLMGLDAKKRLIVEQLYDGLEVGVWQSNSTESDVPGKDLTLKVLKDRAEVLSMRFRTISPEKIVPRLLTLKNDEDRTVCFFSSALEEDEIMVVYDGGDNTAWVPRVSESTVDGKNWASIVEKFDSTRLSKFVSANAKDKVALE